MFEFTAGTGPSLVAQCHDNFSRSHIKIKYLSSGFNGETHVAISKADADSTLTTHSGCKSEAYYDDLRSKLVAVKFYQLSAPCGDLRSEIDFLTNTINVKHPRYTHIINSHVEDKLQWFTMPFIIGGDLQNFAVDFPLAISHGFVSHAASELCEALMFLHFGILDRADPDPSKSQPTPGWPTVYHGDIACRNILLRPSLVGSWYPGLVLADFGTAAIFSIQSPTDLEEDMMALRQSGDVTDAGQVLIDLLQQHTLSRSGIQASHSTLRAAIMRLVRFDGKKQDIPELCLLGEVAGIAKKERNLDRTTLPGAALSFLQKEKVPDALLERAFARASCLPIANTPTPTYTGKATDCEFEFECPESKKGE